MGGIFDLIGTFTDKGKAKPTAPRSMADEIADILNQGPNALRGQESLAPGYNALKLSNLDQILWGTPAASGVRTSGAWSPRWRNTLTGEVRADDPARAKGVNQNLYERFEVPPGSPIDSAPGSGSGASGQPTETTTATKGLVQQYQDLIAPTNAANTATRTATFGDIRGLSPELSALFDELQNSASLGLKAGSTISPEDQYHITSPIRADNANRGFAPGGAGDLEQALALFGGGQALLNQRQATAGNVADLGNRMYVLPTLANSATTSPGALLGGAAGSIPSSNILDQLGSYGNSLFGQNYQGSLGTNLQNANNEMNMWLQTGKQMTDDFGAVSSGFSSGMFCWAARAVFGSERSVRPYAWLPTLKWMVFRDWLLTQAPAKLRNWYMGSAGQRPGGLAWASRLDANPAAKATVRKWMERRIAYA